MFDILALMAEEAAAAAAAEAAAAAAAEGAATAAVTDVAASAMPDMSGMTAPATSGAQDSAMMDGMGGNLGLSELISPPQVSAPPMFFGQQIGNMATNAIDQQMAPAKGLFNTVIDPKSTMGDVGRSAFEYSIKSKEEPNMAPQMSPYSNPYANMANNTVGGIPSLLQNTQSGLLPFFGAR